MAATPDTLSAWLTSAQLVEPRLTPEQQAVLQAAFCFRQQQGDDYYSTRILSHFLLHANTGLKVAHIARLLGLSRPTASQQQRLSSKQTVQQAHHRMDGRPYGKLLPRYAGPIAQFLLTHADASRADILDFIDATFQVRVSRIALYKFLKKYGLDAATLQGQTTPVPPPAPATPAVPAAALPPEPPPTNPTCPPTVAMGGGAPGQPVPQPTPPFSTAARVTPVPSC
jgi:hypothetical protein